MTFHLFLYASSFSPTNLFFKLISCHWSLWIPPENIRKPQVFWCFQGLSKEISGMKWVNLVLIELSSPEFLPFYRLITIFYSTDLEVNPVLLQCSIRFRVFSLKIFLLRFISYETYFIPSKITSENSQKFYMPCKI